LMSRQVRRRARALHRKGPLRRPRPLSPNSHCEISGT
jgi:hypothetical protein